MVALARAAVLTTLFGVTMHGAPDDRGPGRATAVAEAPSVRLRLVRESASGDRLVLVLHVEGSGVALGSYQGTMTFDPAVFTVDSAVAGRDGFRFVNANNLAKGSLRFAGFTATGFKGTDAVRIVARARSPLDNAKIVATLEVAGDIDGRRIADSALQGTKGIEAAARPSSGTPLPAGKRP